MDNYVYALLNSENICVAVSRLNQSINTPNTIKLDTYNTSVLGKKYNDGVWEEVPQPEIPIDDKPTQADRIELLLNQRITEIQEQAVDAYTQQLIEEGTL